MPYRFIKYSIYYAIALIALILLDVKLGHDLFYVYISAPLGILFYYNIYLYFKEAYKSNDRRVPKDVSRILARTSGVYLGVVGICMVATAMQTIDEYHFSSIEVISISGIFYFLGGYIGFYFFVFFIRFSLNNTISKRFTKW